MSSVSFNRTKAKLKQLLGIRARLALLALILVTPLMLERARSLEDARSKQLGLASAEFASLAKHSAEAQREVITMLKVGGLSLEEVARATSSTAGAVKQKAHRGYDRLRKLLRSYAEAAGGAQ